MPLEIEKESLEVHVELCAQRYEEMNEKLDSLDSRTTAIERILNEIKDRINSAKNENTERLLKWSTAIIAFLITIIIGFGGHYISRLEKSIEHIETAKPEPTKQK